MTDINSEDDIYVVPKWVTSPFNKKKKYKIRGLDGFESAEFSQHVQVNLKTRKVIVTAIGSRFACNLAVLDWEGTNDKDGKLIPFDSDVFMKKADGQTVQWLVSEISLRSHVSEEQEKN